MDIANTYYSLYPNLEGIKDVLSYKVKRFMIGQNCCAVCTNEGARALAHATDIGHMTLPRQYYERACALHDKMVYQIHSLVKMRCTHP